MSAKDKQIQREGRVNIRLFLVTIAIWLCFAGAAHAYIIINTPMTGTNSTGWNLGGNPSSAVLTGNGTIDPVGSGWLRLTNSTSNQTGFAYNDTVFDLSAGALIQFDYVSWGGSGADGLSVYLFDANVPTFNIGAFGGSLGYAQKLSTASCSPVTPSVPGISGGYIGFGIDEYGNFATQCEGRYLGANGNTTSTIPNTVTVRGSVSGFGSGAIGATTGSTSYPWLATSANNGLLWVNSATRPDQLSSNYRKVIIRISPAPNPVADVYIQFGFNTTPKLMISSLALPAISVSQQLKVGFGASTGSLTNYHELRNLLITDSGASASIDLGVTKIPVATGTTTPALSSVLVGSAFQYLITAQNFGPNNITATGVGITDTIPSNITPGSWSCSVVTGSPSGTSCGAIPTAGSNTLNTNINLPMSGAVQYLVNATVNAMPAGNSVSNSASLTIPGSVTDYYSGNNSSTSILNVYAPPTVTKSFSPTAILPGGTSTMTITMTNPNNIAATGVTLTDTYPTTASGAPGNMVTAGTTNRATTCGGSTASTTARVQLTSTTANSIPANGSCTLKIDVTAPAAGTYNNTTGAVATTNIGSGSSATGTLIVLAPPTIAKVFANSTIASGDNTNMTVTIGNPNTIPITLSAALTDTFPTGIGMVINTAGNSGTCPSGVTANAGAGSFTIASGTIIPAGGCTVIVNVTSTATGTNTIAAGALQTSAGNNAAATSATLTVHTAATLSKAYAAPKAVATGVNSTLTFTITNGSGTPAQSGMGFTDTFPTGLTVTAVSSISGAGCSGTPTFTPSSVTLSSGAITGGAGNSGPCTFTATVRGDTAGQYINNNTKISSVTGGLITTAVSDTLNVYLPPTVSKSFLPTSIALGGTSVLTLSLTNPATNPGVFATNTVDDTFPTGLKLKDISFTFSPTGCGTLTKIAGGAPAIGDTSIRFNASSNQAVGATCQVTMNITSTTSDNFTNTTTAPKATTAEPITLNGTTASATLNGTAAPTVTKSFANSNIVSGGNTNLTIAISNTNASSINLTSSFTDAFPTGMSINSTSTYTSTCPVVTPVIGATGITMNSGAVIPSGGCTITVNVTSSTPGALVNNIPANALQTSVGNSSAASATLNVYALPTVLKNFAPPGINYGGTSTMTITVTNPATNPGNLTGVSINDTYTGTLSNNGAGSVVCSSGTPVLTGNSTSVGFNSGTITPGGTCIITQNVTATSTNNNTTGAPAASGVSTAGNTLALNGTAGSSTLTVTPQPPTITKAFASKNIASGGNTNLTVTIGNSNAVAIALTSPFTDNFSATGITINTANSTGSCPGVTANINAGNFTMASGTLIPAGGCTIIVNVKSSTAGAAVNTIAIGALQTVAGSNTVAASDTLNVYSPPTVSKLFTPASISSGGTTTMTIAVTNPSSNPGNLIGVSIGDTYTGTLKNSAAGSVLCSGSGAPALTGGAVNGVTVGFNSATIAPGETCTITQIVFATSNNTNTTGTPAATGVSTSGNSLTLTGSTASATLTTTLLPAPTVVKSFAPTQIAKGGTSVLTITLTNPGSIDIIGVGFTDNLPSITTPAAGQMSIPATAVLTNSCVGGSGTIAANKLSFSIAGTTIPANSSCTVSVTVTTTATTTGVYTNTTSTVTSTNATTSATASATLTVALLAPPNVLKTFTPDQIGINGTSVLTVTLTNPDNQDITGATFTDNYPSGLVNTGSPNPATTCGGSSVTATAANNGTSLALANATIPANSSCKVTVNVSSAAFGTYVNNTGLVTTTNANNGTAASATLNVLQSPVAAKLFTPATVLTNAASVLTITLSNPNSITISGVGFTDNYPSGLVSTASTATTNCLGAAISNTTNAITLSGATIQGNTSCTVTVNVKSATANNYTNTTSTISSSNAGTGNAASATLVIYDLPLLTVLKSANVQFASPGQIITYTVQVTNSGAGPGTNVVMQDDPSPYASFRINSGAPFTFTDSSPVSGLTLGTPQYIHNNNGVWVTTLTDGGGNAPAGYDGTVTSWRIPMGGTIRPGGSFSLNYQVIVK
ncbi:MAG: DUF11 domain-containing protein [Geobacteraceae bacterium]|nr:DUF11 domain-containing protein [Geobacteraceae bacterium]